MARYSSSRMVLREARAKEQVEAVARAAGWALTGESSSGRLRLTWKAGPATELEYVEDDMSPNSFVVITSLSAKLVSAKAQQVFEALSPWTLDELIAQALASTAPLAHGLAVLRVGIAAPHAFHFEVFDLIRRALAHPDERVRDMALWATTYSPWPEYENALREIATNDTVVVLRERAQSVLDAYEAAAIGR